MARYSVNERAIAKAAGDTWHVGTSLYYVLHDLTLARWSQEMFPVPYWMTKVLTIMVLWWELLFLPVMLVPWRWIADRIERARWPVVRPLHVLFRWNREIMLVFGALFHVGIWLTMEIGWFGPYMLCLYLPLVPWERWTDRRRAAPGERPA